MKYTFTKGIFSLLLLLIASSVYSQTGPGGVGNSDGSNGQPENLIWLDASDLLLFGDGDTWPDKSGNGNHALNTGGIGGATLGNINGVNAINFIEGNNGFLTIADDNAAGNRLDGMDSLTIIVVANVGNSQPRALISKRAGSGSSERSYAMFTIGDSYNLRGYAGGFAVSNDDVDINVSNDVIAAYVYRRGTDFNIFTNSNEDSAPSVATDAIPDRSESILLGRFDLSDGRYFNGQIGEVIVYRDALSELQFRLVHGYLSNKYGITSYPFNVLYQPTDTYYEDITANIFEGSSVNDYGLSGGLGVALLDSVDTDYVTAGHNGDANAEANIRRSGDVTAAAGVVAAWNRAWYVQHSSLNDKIRLSFDFSEGLAVEDIYPQDISNYVLLRKNTSTGSYSEVTPSFVGIEEGDRLYFEVEGFQDGYYTIGTKDEILSPLQGGTRRIWYTLRSTANWDSPGAWTLEPCGCLPNNPNNYTPITSPTSAVDKVVVLSGNKITVPAGVNNLTNAELVVDGELDLQNTTGHTFSVIRGRGQITMLADNFPSGNAYDFITPGEGEGKVVYKGGSYSITTQREFFNVDILLDGASDELSLLADLKVNGSLRVENGIMRINDNSSTTSLNIDVDGELYIGTNAQIQTGTANARHQLNLYGDLTNLGTVKFTQRTSASYNSDATDGIVDVNLLSAVADQVITCDGPTIFYRIEIDKGIDKTYVASINAASIANFGLYGRANYGHSSVAQLGSNDNALGLIKGTVRLGQNITVGQLNTSGNYNVSEAARLWIDGGDVSKTSGTAIVPYGEVKVSAGVLNANVSSGITLRDNGIIRVDGGELNVYQIRTSVLGSEHQGGYVQTGGVTNVTGLSTNADYYVFNLTYEGNTFQMSGGELNINQANSNGGIFINSIAANYSVTGGTVNCNIANDNNFVITSRAPFYNLNLTKSGGNATQFVLEDGVDVGSTNVDLTAQPLVVLNDLRIRGEESGADYPDIELRARASNVRYIDVYIGGSLFIEEGAEYHAYRNDNYHNTTFFNQTIATSSIDTIYSGYPNNKRHNVGNLVIDRTSGNEVRMVANGSRSNSQIMIDVRADATVESGTLCQGRMTLRTWGKITNKDRMGTWYATGPYPTTSGTPTTAQIRLREDPPVEIETTDGAIFGNTRFNVDPVDAHIVLTSNMKIERLEFMRGAVYLKGYKLTVDNMWNFDTGGNNIFVDRRNSDELIVSDVGIDGNKLFYTDGKASDGGLEIYIYQDSPNENNGNRDNNVSPITFPIGFTTDGGTTIYNRPAQMKVKNFSDDGYVQIRPVSGELKTTNASGSPELLQQYWRVSHYGFTTVPDVAFQFYYRDQEGVAGIDKVTGASQEANYVPGYVLDEAPYTRRYESDDINGTPPSPVSDVNDVVNTGSAGLTRRIVFNGTSTGGDFTQAGFAGFQLVNANFTCGEISRFSGAPEIYYNNRGNRNWNSTSSWYMNPERTVAASDYPRAGDIAIISGSTFNHNITVNGTQECAQVILEREGTYSNIETLPRLRVQPNDVLNVARISGVGDLYLQHSTSASATVNADIGDFAANDTSVVEFYMTQAGTYSIDEADFFNVLPTLRVYTSGGNAGEVTFNYDFECANLVVDGHSVLNIGGNYEVENQTRLGFTYDGNIVFPNGTEAYTFKTKDIFTSTGKGNEDERYSIYVESGNSNAVEHNLIVEGNIDFAYRGGADSGDRLTFDLYNSATENNAILTLQGDNSGQFDNAFTSSQSNIDLYKIKINKWSNIDTTFIFNADFNLDAAANGDDKNIILENGLLVLNNSDVDINLSTGGAYFVINGSSGLEIRQGTAKINGGSGLSLDGLLKISGGTLDMRGGDHPIVYSISGNAAIDISGASSQLLVGSQIRRPETDELGVLKYTQTDGTVEIGTDAGGLSSRGMFEVLNTGSLFNYTGGSLTIVQQNGATPSKSALLLDPSSYNLTGSTIYLFNTNTPGAQTAFGINSAIPLNNLLINGTNNPTVDLRVRNLYLTGSLTIESGAELDAKGFSVDLQGNWNNSGLFTPSDNEVLFTGSVPQAINGTTLFYNLTKQTGGDILTLGASTDITVSNLLTLSDGTIHDGGNNIFVKKDIVNNGSFTSAGGNGVVLNGTILGDPQLLSGSGTYDRMYLDNSSGFELLDGNEITINQNFQMENGIFNIGKNLIVFGENATVQSIAGFSATNMIETNISFVDAGLKKLLPTGSLTFVYPMGSGGLYTPLTLNVTNNTASEAYIRIKGAKEVHPSVIDETSTSWNEQENVLNYYWILDANGLNDFRGNFTMEYPNSLVKVTAPRLYEQYITARLLSRGTGLWDKGSGVVNTTTDQLTFTFASDTGDDNISGDYTAGINEAIPDQVPVYTSQMDGDWTDVSIWSPMPPIGGPRGAQVVVNHDVNVSVDYISSYKTTIDGDTNGRILIQPATGGHRLGNVQGDGTIYLENGSLPAGDYTTFLDVNGGTLEFGGTDEVYPVLSGVNTVNNIKFSGTGTRSLPNDNLTILGDLTIEQGAGTLIVDNAYDKTINVKQDIVYNGGIFVAGTGTDATIVLNGSVPQTISGTSSFTGSNAFYNLQIDNANGVALSNALEVSRVLYLSNGNINTELGSLTLTYSETNALQGGGLNSYIEGPMTKRINLNESFTFPVGRVGRYGGIHISHTSIANGLWQATYFNTNPSGGGYNTDNRELDLAFVNQNEYWTVKAPSAATANLTLSWDSYSGVIPDDDFTIAMWKSAGSQWEKVDITNKTGTASSGSVRTQSVLSFNEFAEGNTVTFGSLTIPSYEWVGATSDWFTPSNWLTGTVPGAGVDLVIKQNGQAPIIDNSDVAQVNNLTIDHTGGLTLQAGAQMTVNGDLVTNDRLYINNTADDPTSFIVLGTITGDVSTSWYYSELYWYFIGHSINNPQMQTYRDILTTTPGQKYALYDYQDGGSLVNLASGSNEFAVNDEIRGYQLKVLLPQSITHTGILNNAASYERFAQDGWQIVANPYPAYYKIPQAASGTGDFAATTGTVYVSVSPTNQTKTFQTYNISTGISSPSGFKGILAPSQAFYVETDASATPGVDKLYMSASNRFHDINKTVLKSAKSESDVLRVKLRNAFGAEDEAVVALREEGDLAMTRIDSKQRFYNGTNISYVYSMVEDNKAVINVLPSDMYGQQVALGMKLKQGNHTIRIDGLNTLSEDYPILLEDKNGTGAMVEMDANSEYTFTVDEDVELNDRFVLHFGKSKVATDIDDKPSESADDVKVYIENSSKLVVYCDWVGDKQVYLFTIDGRMVSTEEFKGDSYTKVLSLQPGVYVVKVIGENEQYEQKVFVK